MKYKITIPVIGTHTFLVEAESKSDAIHDVIHKRNNVKDLGTSLEYNWIYHKIDDKYPWREDDYS